ncbi:MAG: hypothetical protein LBK06_08735 [Planctomycetaceae bacterium]|jgi:hypothetical protein|nr:hypothetical protein [Planctomycetaceae bacterium]
MLKAVRKAMLSSAELLGLGNWNNYKFFNNIVFIFRERETPISYSLFVSFTFFSFYIFPFRDFSCSSFRIFSRLKNCGWTKFVGCIGCGVFECISVMSFICISVSLADILVVEPDKFYLNNSEIHDDGHRQLRWSYVIDTALAKNFDDEFK